MSHPIPTQDRPISRRDLDTYLSHIEKSLIHYRAEDVVRPHEYNRTHIKKLNAMAVEAMDRYYNQ